MGTFVVDQNYFRKPALVQLLDTDKDSKIAIPDVALIEMCKSPQWESTLRGSLIPLAPYAERCICITNIGEPLRYEAENHKAYDGNLVNEDFSILFRSIIKEVASVDGLEIARFRNMVPSVIGEIESEDLNHSANKRSISGTVDVLLESFNTTVTKALRNGSIDRDSEIELISRNMPELMNSYLNQVSFPQEARESYLAEKPFAYRFVALRLWLSIHWVKKGGLGSLPESKATNHIMDHEYVLIASYFDGFLSEDALAKEAYSDLCEIIRK